MWEYFQDIFSTKFVPKGYCFFWRPEILWLHVLSDLMIAISFLSIPAVLMTVVYKRKEIPFRWVFILFALFIFLNALIHILGLISVWIPMYQFEGLIKSITAAVSIAMAILLLSFLPRFLHSSAAYSQARLGSQDQNELDKENF